MSILDVRVNRTWDQFASCRDMDSDIFFPDAERGEKPSAKAREICSTCVVKRECLALAMSTPKRDDWFFYGGTTEADRVILRRARAVGIEFDIEDLDLEELESKIKTAESKARYARSRESQLAQKKVWRDMQRESKGQ